MLLRRRGTHPATATSCAVLRDYAVNAVTHGTGREKLLPAARACATQMAAPPTALAAAAAAAAAAATPLTAPLATPMATPLAAPVAPTAAVTRDGTLLAYDDALAPVVAAAAAGGVAPVRAAQVARAVEASATRRTEAERVARGLCPRCGFPAFVPPAVVAYNAARCAKGDVAAAVAAAAALPPQPRPRTSCVCAAITPLPCRHKVTALVHAAELARQSSTHQILAAGLQHAAVRVWQSADTPTVAAAWEEVVAECAVSGRTPVVLYPAKDAIPAAALFRALPPAAQAAGLHVLVLDGTWSNVKPMARDIPPTATKVVIEPPRVCTLFSPLRTQPSPGRVSTIEAVACLFDELRVAQRLPAGASTAGAAAPVSTQELLLASALRAARASMVEADYRGPDLWGSRLRYYLMVWVDACLNANGKLGTTAAGSGYQTWHLGAAAGAFAALPARLVTHIAQYAYGADAVCTGGFKTKVDLGGSAHWRTLLDAAAGGGGDSTGTTAAAVAGVTPATAAAAATARAAGGAGGAPPMPGSGVAWFARDGKLHRRAAYRRLPFPTPYTRIPLAATCLDMLRLQAGVFCGSWAAQPDADGSGTAAHDDTASLAEDADVADDHLSGDFSRLTIPATSAAAAAAAAELPPSAAVS